MKPISSARPVSKFTGTIPGVQKTPVAESPVFVPKADTAYIRELERQLKDAKAVSRSMMILNAELRHQLGECKTLNSLSKEPK